MFVEIKQEINIKNSLEVKYIKINKKIILSIKYLTR